MGRRRRLVEEQEQLDLFSQAEPNDPPSGLAAAVTPPPPPAPLAVRQDRNPLRLVRTTAHELAEKIAAAWYGHRAGDGIAIPLGVTAALSMLGQKHVRDGRNVPQHVLSLDPEQLLQFLREVWAHAWMFDPYLTASSYELWAWLDDKDNDPPATVLNAVHSVARAAIAGGLFGLTGDPDPVWRCEHDVLGALLTMLRSHGARDALAEFHTPPEIASLMARMTLLEIPEPGGAFDDPAAGTGGLMRAVALSLRLQGADPHDYEWSMGDIDPLAAACCAVNAVVWSLGRNVLISCGDTLAVGNGPQLAAQRRREVLDNHERLMFAVAGVQAVIEADEIVNRLMRPAA